MCYFFLWCIKDYLILDFKSWLIGLSRKKLSLDCINKLLLFKKGTVYKRLC
jgi:hypothetical protein